MDLEWSGGPAQAEEPTDLQEVQDFPVSVVEPRQSMDRMSVLASPLV